MERTLRVPARIVEEQAAYFDPDIADWPFPQTRLAGALVPRLYAGGHSARQWARDWAQQHHCAGTISGLQMERYGMVMDELLHELNVFNSPAVEIIARHMYGFVKAFERVQSDAGARNEAKAKDRVQFAKVGDYDLLLLDRCGATIAKADEEVEQRLLRKAKYEKYSGAEGRADGQ